jgi:ATP-binding cassette subfamily A (ABC1) protein 3
MNKSLETKMEMNILNGNTYSKVDPEAPINDDNPDYGLWIGSSSNHLINNIFLNLLNQFKALIIKRIIYTLRNKTLLLTQVLLPVFILVVYLLIIKYAPIKTGDSPPLPITFANYSFNYVPYITSTNQNSTDQINMLASLTNQYRNHLIQQSNVQVYDLNNQSEVKHCAKQSKSIDEYNSCIVWKFRIAEHIVATDFKFEKVRNRNKLKITGHFDNQRYHLAPLSLNLITNTLYKHYSNNSEYSINLVNHPLPRNLTELANEINKADITSFLLLTGIQFGFAFLISSFGIFLINERVSGAKHLQHLNGCSSAMFWLSALSWDIFNYLVPVVLAIIAFFVSYLLKIFIYFYNEIKTKKLFPIYFI